MRTILTSLFILALAAFPVINCPAQEEIITVSGSVAALDLANSIITINYVDENNTSNSITLQLSETLEVFDAAGIEDVSAGDDVTVDYLIDENSNQVAVYLYKFIPE